MIVTINHVLQEATKLLKDNGKMDASIDARLLLAHVLNYDRVGLLIHGNEELELDTYVKYNQLIELRINGIPLQHILGEQDFMGITFKVNQDTLVPRRETEELVELALGLLSEKKEQIVIDIGTGSGCIPIALASFNKSVSCLGIDISASALKIAKSNGEMNHVDKQITWILSDLFQEISNEYYNHVDMIISNPPYIKTEDIETLMVEVKEHEPRMALDGGEDGLVFYRRICNQGKRFLKKEGYILFEIGHDQKESVVNILKENGYKNLGYKKDLSGLDRIVYAQK